METPESLHGFQQKSAGKNFEPVKIFPGRKLMLTIGCGHEIPWPETLSDKSFAWPKDYRMNDFPKTAAGEIRYDIPDAEYLSWLADYLPANLPPLSQPFTDVYLDAAGNLIKEAQNPEHDIIKTSSSLINQLNSPETNQSAALLLDMPRDTGGRLNLASDLLTQAKIHNRVVKGLVLSKNNRNKKLSSYIEVFDGKKWQLLNPKTAEVEDPDAFLIWQRHNESLLEIEGGSKAKTRFSSL
jgi:hypothetical protein